MSRSLITLLVVAASVLASGIAQHAAAADGIQLHKRYQEETAEGSGRFHTRIKSETWEPKATAVIVCDMWDRHHCLNATRRGAEVAPRMNQVLKKLRSQGVTVIHAPSSCVGAYQDHPARKHAMQTPRAKSFPAEISQWCHQIPSEEQGEYPIDQSDGGEDDDPQEHAAWAKKLEQLGLNPRGPWKSQTDLLEIKPQDYISDQGEEIWSILADRGIDNVILLGVHTNMCVLGRPFGLRQMARNGKNVVLMRDMTDTMYNPQRKPFVSHFTGTDLIVAHIEKWVCPTITSDQILGGSEFRFQHDKRPHVVIVMAEREYETNVSLPQFALANLGKKYRVSYVHADAKERNTLPGIEVLEDADLLLLSVRRRALPQAQMKVIRRFIESGKPVVGIRTANHALSLRGKEPPEGCVVWENFDQQVIGGNYSNHHGAGPKVALEVAKTAAKHPVLADVDVSKLQGCGSLYVVSPLADSATPLLIGAIPGKDAEPIAWTNKNPFGGRVFYTSLGHVDDFAQPGMNQLLSNAIDWALASQPE